jgi:hypothetical protein
MEGADALGLIGEVGIAVAGFAGVVAVLRAPGGRMEPYSALRIGVLLAESGTAAVMALLPFVLHHAKLDTSAIWTVSSAALAALVLLILMVALLLGKRLFPAAPDQQPAGIWLMMPLYLGLFGIIIAFQLFNLAFARQFWPFLAGLLALTVLSLFMFAHVLFAPARSEVQP